MEDLFDLTVYAAGQIEERKKAAVRLAECVSMYVCECVESVYV